VRATIIMDKKTDSSRGYGFVDVASQEDAERALRAHGTTLHGRVLGVERVRRFFFLFHTASATNACAAPPFLLQARREREHTPTPGVYKGEPLGPCAASRFPHVPGGGWSDALGRLQRQPGRAAVMPAAARAAVAAAVEEGTRAVGPTARAPPRRRCPRYSRMRRAAAAQTTAAR
jgi:hypothetical protein